MTQYLMLCADDQVLLSDLEDVVQTDSTIKQPGMEISQLISK